MILANQYPTNPNWKPENIRKEKTEGHISDLFSILDFASNKTHRKIKESIYILCHKPTLNDKIKDHVYHLFGI